MDQPLTLQHIENVHLPLQREEKIGWVTIDMVPFLWDGPAGYCVGSG